MKEYQPLPVSELGEKVDPVQEMKLKEFHKSWDEILFLWHSAKSILEDDDIHEI